MSESGAVTMTAHVVVSRLAQPLGAVLLLIVIGRHSDVLLGQYALVTTFFFVMQQLSLLGLTPLVMREVAREPRRAGAYYSTIGTLLVASCLVLALLAALFLPFSGYSVVVRDAIAVVGVLIVPGALALLAEMILISVRRTRPVAWNAIAENVLRLALSMIALHLGGEVVALMWVLLGTRIGALWGFLESLRRSGAAGILALPEWSLLRRTLTLLPTFLFGAILLVARSRLDFLVLSFFADIEVIGYYAIGYRLFEVGMVMLSAVLMAVFPWIARRFTGARLHFIVAARGAVILITFVLLPAALAGFSFAEEYVRILFSHQYPHPVLLTQLFMLIVIPAGIDFVSQAVLHATDQQNRDLAANSAGSVAYAALLLALVPAWGVYGALTAFLISTVLQGALRAFFLRRSFRGLLRGSDWARILCVVLALLILASLAIGEPLSFRVLTVAILTALALPAMLLATRLAQPARLLRFFWKARASRPPGTFPGLLDRVILDLRRYARWARARRREGGAGAGRSKSGLTAVLLYRLSSHSMIRGGIAVSLALWKANRWLTGADLSPHASAGPGLLVRDPASVLLAGRIGRNVTLDARVRIGDAGGAATPHACPAPVIGDGVTLGSDCHVRGEVEVPPGVTLPPGARVTSPDELRRYVGE